MNYGGFWLRFVALIIDSIIIGILQWIIILPILGFMGFTMFSAGNVDTSDPESAAGLAGVILAGVGMIWIVTFVLSVLYYSFMESSSYQGSVGKIALGLIVTDMNGNKLDFSKAFVRNLCKIISNLSFLIGYIVALFTEKHQALHDILAGTLVLRKDASTAV